MEVLNLLIERDPLVPCSKKARRAVRDEMKFSTTVVVSNYIKSLKEKQAILQTPDGYVFNPLLIIGKDQNAIELIWE
jgi:hypothetical protein